ncbi:DUF86 domain-containing protein [Patescibacteria group bacterium]|nr:DUF86 domain-containing protein [Patescibacteria group bacterium]
MSPIDRQLIIRKAKLIDRDLRRLKKFGEMSLTKYKKDEDSQMIVERILEKATSRLIEINYHILREEFDLLPIDYHNSFVEIGRKKVVGRKFAEKIASAAGLRNALAHDYDELDQSQIYASIKTSLDQIPRYLQKIFEYFK